MPPSSGSVLGSNPTKAFGFLLKWCVCVCVCVRMCVVHIHACVVLMYVVQSSEFNFSESGVVCT